MAYPTVASYSSGYSDGNQVSTTITLPTGANIGDSYLLFFSKDGSAAPTNVPAGWTLVGGTADSGGASYFTIYSAYNNGALALTITHASEGTSWICLRFTTGIEVQISSVAQGSSTLPDPPSLTQTFMSGSSTEVLWIAAASWDYNRAISAYPSGFSTFTYGQLPSSSAGATTAVAGLNSTTSPQNPGTFTMGSSDTWNAYTLAVRALVNGKYYIERKTGSGGTWAEINTDDSSPYTDSSSFSGDTTYYYRIRQLVNGVFTDYSNIDYVAYSAGTNISVDCDTPNAIGSTSSSGIVPSSISVTASRTIVTTQASSTYEGIIPTSIVAVADINVTATQASNTYEGIAPTQILTTTDATVTNTFATTDIAGIEPTINTTSNVSITHIIAYSDIAGTPPSLVLTTVSIVASIADTSIAGIAATIETLNIVGITATVAEYSYEGISPSIASSASITITQAEQTYEGINPSVSVSASIANVQAENTYEGYIVTIDVTALTPPILTAYESAGVSHLSWVRG